MMPSEFDDPRSTLSDTADRLAWLVVLLVLAGLLVGLTAGGCR